VTRRLLALILLAAATAHAQTFAEDPTGGVALPIEPLAGDVDATTTTVNPAGLPFLGDWHVAAVYTGLGDERIEGTGTGWGLWAGTPIAIPFLPRFGFGVALEGIDPPRELVAPDPGRPLRISFAGAYAPSKTLAFGIGLHHFVDSSGGLISGLTTFDVGLAARLGAHFALGLVVRDLFAPSVGDVPLERHWDGELIARPLATDALEIAAGLVFGDRRDTLEPRLRLSVRLTRGLWLRAAAELRTRLELVDPAAGAGDTTSHTELRATAGLEVSFGGLGAGGYAIVSAGDSGTRLAGASVVARWSDERYPSMLPRPAHVERVKISGGVGDHELTALVGNLHRIERDDSVHGIFLQLDGVSAGWATLQELRSSVARLRARQKRVFAYIIAGGTRDYYLAAACDKIYLDASGGLRLVGLSQSAMYFKDVFDKIGVLAQFEKIAEYKSAPEQFTMEGPSPPAAEMRESLLDDVWNRLVADLAHDRGLGEDQVRRMFDDGPYTAGDAGAARLVDAVVEPEDLDRLVADAMGGAITLGERPKAERSDSWALPQVAVVYLDGDIVDGKSVEVPILGQRLSGGETISAALAWARENPRVAAIVLRVDSPGGSALASDQIAREVANTRGKKPIVVSIGNVAASGGYFAAAPGDVIFAEPSAITGSIGIFTGKFDVSALLNRLGVTWETSRRGAHADMESFLRPYTDEERARIREKLRYYYDRFVGTVARGRGMTEEQVDGIGRGHVWTGQQALARHLVDRHGSLLDAILEAKRRAGLGVDEPAELVPLPAEPTTILGQLLKLAGASDGALVLPGRLARLLPASILLEPDALQARLPFVLDDATH
jgi:protease-4